MNNSSKLAFSQQELQLVNNAELILTKRKIVQNVEGFMGELAAFQLDVIAATGNLIPDAVLNNSPKIAKGENYLELPYLILDYPRYFNDENIFALRTMFWWGNFFSVTLHLAGTYKTQFQNRLLEKLTMKDNRGLCICRHESQWHHHFGNENYIEVDDLSIAEIKSLLDQRSFLKLVIRIPIDDWMNVEVFLKNGFEYFINLLRP